MLVSHFTKDKGKNKTSNNKNFFLYEENIALKIDQSMKSIENLR